MGINKMIYKVMMLMIMFIFLCSCTCYAGITNALERENGGGQGTAVTGNDELGLPTLNDMYKPTVAGTGTAVEVISKILSVLTGLGIIAIVISVAVIGFNMILGSASEKAIAQEKYVGIVIAGLLITGGSIIAKMIISVAENF